MKYLFSLLFFAFFSVVAAAQPAENPKSYKYILYSLAIPGLGEYQMGDSGYLKYFLTTEAVLLVGAYSLDYYSNSLLNNALNYAENKAGYTGKETSRELVLAMGAYNSLFDYNLAMRRDRNIEAAFPDNNPDFYWQWNSESDRFTYREKRRKADLAGSAVPFVVGAVFINHAVSAFNVLRLIKTGDKESTGMNSPDSPASLWASPVDPVSGQWGNGILVSYNYQF